MKEDPNRSTISFKTDAATRERIDKLANTSGRTKSTHAREALSLYLDLREVFHGSDLEFSTIMQHIIDQQKNKNA